MSMTVLEIIQAACYELGIPAPSSLTASPTDGTKQLINLFNAVGRDLRQAKCWPQLKKTYTFATSNGDSAYPMPTDFYCSLLDTYWDTTNRWKMAGPQTDSRYNELLYGYAVFSNFTYFRVFGLPGTDQFQIQPTPGSSSINLQFDYVSKNWIGTGSAPYTWSEVIVTNSDVCAFDDDLMILGVKSRYCQAKGLEFSSYQAEYANKVDAAQARWQGSKKVNLFAYDGILAGLYPNVPEGSWTL